MIDSMINGSENILTNNRTVILNDIEYADYIQYVNNDHEDSDYNSTDYSDIEDDDEDDYLNILMNIVEQRLTRRTSI